jgi:hypothetical protein
MKYKNYSRAFALVATLGFSLAQENLALGLDTNEVIRFCAFTPGITCGGLSSALADFPLPKGGRVIFSKLGTGVASQTHIYLEFSNTKADIETIMHDYITDLIKTAGWLRYNTKGLNPALPKEEGSVLCKFYPDNDSHLETLNFYIGQLEGYKGYPSDNGSEYKVVVDLIKDTFAEHQLCTIARSSGAPTF